MPQWVYKATRTKRNQDDTLDLARKYDFLCRSAYENEKEKHPALVHDVKLGDVIHFYYVGKARVAEFGSYSVVDGAAHPGRFSSPVAGCALVGVLEEPQNAKLIDFLVRKNANEEGYERDPVLDVFTGWALKRLGKAPRFNQGRFFSNPHASLARYPDADWVPVLRAPG